ncbi:MAG TPA: DUF1588 domain-containing protein [Polyangiaceae bacterium]|nr:DUF1588 domain-containing protein [Polyangiaceae bacterium]
MRRVCLRLPIAVVPRALALALLGCDATIIESPSGSAGASGAGAVTPGGLGGGANGGGTASNGAAANSGGLSSASGGSAGGGVNGGVSSAGGNKPTLEEVAKRYFPSDNAVNANKRLSRLTRMQLDLTTKTLLPKQFAATASASLPRDPLQTNYEYADNLSFNPANFSPFINWVAGMSAAVKADPRSVIDCKSSNDSVECLTDRAKRFVNLAFRGTASEAQLNRYAEFFTGSVATVGLPTATAELVDLVLTSPNYVFRDEVATDGTGALLPAQQLQNITYTLADAPPDALGLSSATPLKQLSSPAVVQSTIDQVLATPEARNKLLRFFLAWLEVKEPAEFGIASSVFPEFTEEVATAVVAETAAFLEHQLARAAPSMKDITESTESFATNAGAFLYGNAASKQLDPAQRLGIFTQPAVLASHSGPTTSRLVKRGVFFVRKIMCMPLGSPPPNVDISISPSAGKTERERIENGTAKAPCNGCHGVINPFGFMQENFDAIGRWRTSDEGVPIDPHIEVNFLDEGPFTANTPVEALRTFTRSWRFQQCFARQLFRFYSGRDETAGDDPLLRQMFLEFANDNGQDIVRMLHTLASSSAFSRRSEVQ